MWYVVFFYTFGISKTNTTFYENRIFVPAFQVIATG